MQAIRHFASVLFDRPISGDAKIPLTVATERKGYAIIFQIPFGHSLRNKHSPACTCNKLTRARKRIVIIAEDRNIVGDGR